MREIRTSGLMSGEGKRVTSVILRPSSTLLFICFSLACVVNSQGDSRLYLIGFRQD